MCLLNPAPPNPTRPHEPHTDQISTILLFQTWGRVGGCNRSPLFPLHQPCHLDNALPLVLTSPLGIATPPTLTCTYWKKHLQHDSRWSHPLFSISGPATKVQIGHCHWGMALRFQWPHELVGKKGKHQSPTRRKYKGGACQFIQNRW